MSRHYTDDISLPTVVIIMLGSTLFSAALAYQSGVEEGIKQNTEVIRCELIEPALT